MKLGTATAEPGEIGTGHLDVAELPTGVTERLPVVVAEGETEGPELWITATIHGDEANGLAAAQDVVHSRLPEGLRGRVVCLPALNPAGLRRNERTSYYGGKDPNRCFPEPGADGDEPPTVQERILERVYDAFAGSADALIDLHTAEIGAVPFNIRHRVLYGDRRSEADARELAGEQERLMEAFGLPIVTQYDRYTADDRHRTTVGAALNYAGIPAMTVELGGPDVVDDDLVDAGVAGCYRVMEALDMVDDGTADGRVNAPTYEAPVDFPVKRVEGPWTDAPGIVRHRVDNGEAFSAGDVLATIVTTHGNEKATVEAARDGYVVNRRVGAAVYENDPVASVVARDEGDIVVPRADEE